MTPDDLYLSGKSIPEVSAITGVPKATLHNRFKRAGILRSRSDGVRLAASKGLLGSGMRGKKREFSDEHKASLAAARVRWVADTAVGTSTKPNGYLEFTTGEHKGRLVHVVIMEKRLGRGLLPDEEVHHIDRDRSNNDDDNLALLTKAGHGRLHRFEDALEGNRRDDNGRLR